jgi:hypothetical protein
MKNRWIWYSALGVVFFTILVVSAVRLARQEWGNAIRLRIYADIQEIARALQEYENQYEAYPTDLSGLQPTFISGERLNGKIYREWCSRKILVPMNPYGMRAINGDVFITCTFNGIGYTQIIFECKTGITRVE